jgi:hypothetical protein
MKPVWRMRPGVKMARKAMVAPAAEGREEEERAAREPRYTATKGGRRRLGLGVSGGAGWTGG